MPRKKAVAGFVVLVVLSSLVALAFSNIYYIREDSAGTLLWSADEAYLFMSVVRRGFRIGYLEYPWVIFKQYLNAPPFPDDRRVSVVVIRVTASAVERQVVDFPMNSDHGPTFLTLLEKSIYANCQGVLCRWTGTRFELASDTEQRRLDGINRLSVPNFSGVEGWSRQGVGSVTGDSQFLADVGGKVTLVVNLGNSTKSAYSSASVDLLRSGQVPQRIWYLDGNPRSISKKEYQNRFGSH